jgi:spermidine/putrescine transport system permease protein
MEESDAKPRRQRSRSQRWLVLVLLAPGVIWLAVFFVLPLLQMLSISVSTGSLETGFTGPPEYWDLSNYADLFSRYSSNFRNSIVLGGFATVFVLLIGYPIAYAIATRGGRYKNLLLMLVVAPFFTSYLVRIVSWQTLLGPEGPLLSLLRNVGIASDGFTMLGTPAAVVAGLTYQLIPFAVLPLYSAIERLDPRLVEAAEDLYAGPWRFGYAAGALAGGLLFGGAIALLSRSTPPPTTILVAALAGAALGSLLVGRCMSESFVRVLLPLSAPGIFAATLLTGIPALGDYVNASLLGSPDTQMVGNAIASLFLVQNDYVSAAALSFIGMVVLLVAVAWYTRAVGAKRVLEDAV